MIPMSQSNTTGELRTRGSFGFCDECAPRCKKCGLPIRTIAVEKFREEKQMLVPDRSSYLVLFGVGACEHAHPLLRRRDARSKQAPAERPPHETTVEDEQTPDPSQPDWLLPSWSKLTAVFDELRAGLADRSRPPFRVESMRPPALQDSAVARAQMLIANHSLDEEIRPTESSLDHQDTFFAVSIGYHAGWWGLGRYPPRALSQSVSIAPQELASRLAVNVLDSHLQTIAAQIVTSSGRSELTAPLRVHAADSRLGQRLGRERVMPTISVLFTAGILLSLIEAALLCNTDDLPPKSYDRASSSAATGADPVLLERADYISKHVIAAGLAERCDVELSYADDGSRIVLVSINAYGTEMVPVTRIEHLAREWLLRGPDY